MKNFIKKITDIFSEKIGIAEIRRMVSMDRRLSIASYLNNFLYMNPKYTNSNRLNKYEFSIRSQDGGDGIIREIFNRIGVVNKQFVEFGVGDGLQNNTAALLLDEWKGVWFEGDPHNYRTVEKNLKNFIDKKQLNLIPAFVTAENIEKLFVENKVGKELDFLSIDIDGNDYWVWKSIKTFKPRVVVLEYNASYGPYISVVPEYNEKYFWKRTHFYGSSISAFNKLAKDKGYTLVACTFLGNNAYFVRNDLLGDKFDKNLSAIDLYEDHKAFLLQDTKYSTKFVDVVRL
jgi:hypothetical protein